MRKVWIDTDCGSDDAVALIMALKSPELEIMGMSTIGGNVPLQQATLNTLMTIEVVNHKKPPVYVGVSQPLFRRLVTAEDVHGHDGMGDCDLIHPTLKAESKHGVDAMLEMIEQYPHEIELIALGPVTNIAIAILKSPETMKKVKRIYSMGTSGFGQGNTSPVAEFNVYVDAEAYNVMLSAGLPITIIGYDVCLGDGVLFESDLDILLNSNKPEAIFTAKCNTTKLKYNQEASHRSYIGLADAVAMAVVLWDDIVIEAKECYCHVCTNDEYTYGQVILDDKQRYSVSSIYNNHDVNATVCKKLDLKEYKQRVLSLLLK